MTLTPASTVSAQAQASGGFKWIPAIVAGSLAIVAISVFLTYREYAKTTPLGAQSFVAQMETERSRSHDEVRLRELDLQQQEFEKRCK